ncbi:MAG: ATP-binding protein [Gemmatimonadaceae bacterium]
MTELPQSVLDALPLTVYTTDLEGRITSTFGSWDCFAVENGAPALAEQSGVLGRTLWSAISDPANRTQVEQAFELLRTGKAARVSWEFPCNSPEQERVFLMQVTPLREQHHVRGFVFCTVDITPSHRSREALIETGLALSRTIDLDRIFAEVGHQLRHALGADAFAVLVPDERGEIRVPAYAMGYEGLPGAVAEDLAELVHEAVANNEVTTRAAGPGLELAAPMISGSRTLGVMTLLLEPVASPQAIEEARRVLATIAAQTAVSMERAGLVKRVAKKQRLEAIGEVVAGVAHELRNPLFGISAAAQLLRFRAKDDPVVEKNIGRVLREVERLNRMVTSLLEFGRPKAIVLTNGDPDALWDDVLVDQQGLLESRALAVRRSRPSQPVRCEIDHEQLRQVFLNILVNATDHAPEGSDLILDSLMGPLGSWHCRLTNAGPSIPPEVLPRVFEIFFSNKPGGTGIGLALCQRIIEEHGGEISLESSDAVGTSLILMLPTAIP